jgi:hypothetical protein
MAPTPALTAEAASPQSSSLSSTNNSTVEGPIVEGSQTEVQKSLLDEELEVKIESVD